MWDYAFFVVEIIPYDEKKVYIKKNNNKKIEHQFSLNSLCVLMDIKSLIMTQNPYTNVIETQILKFHVCPQQLYVWSIQESPLWMISMCIILVHIIWEW